jgi:hypothetical protein
MSTELKGPEYFKAQAKKIGISETKTGKPQVAIDLVDESGVSRTWFGSLNEGRAREITIEVLKILNFNGKMSDLINGTGIDFEKEVQITVDDRWNEDRTKSYRGITWINDLNKGAKLLAEADAIQKLQGMGIEADFALAFTGVAGVKKDEVPF